jgi:hypothetical protein
MDTPTGLTFDDLPQLFNAADRAAVDGRRRYMSQSGRRLVATVIAAGAAIAVIRIGRVDWAGIVSSAAFIVALLLDLSLLRARPERDWYDGRALAESAKTLGWKWAVGGNPYPCSQTLSDARMLLADDLSRLRESAGDVALDPVLGSVVTDAMQALRDSPLEVRKQAYLADRLDDQLRWYAKKASDNLRAARRWRSLLLALEAIGGLMGVLKATGVVDIPIDALMATAVSAVGAWLEAQQHDQLSRAYSVAVADLTDARVRLEASSDEEVWATVVNDTEDAISREHTRWRASRSQP